MVDLDAARRVVEAYHFTGNAADEPFRNVVLELLAMVGELDERGKQAQLRVSLQDAHLTSCVHELARVATVVAGGSTQSEHLARWLTRLENRVKDLERTNESLAALLLASLTRDTERVRKRDWFAGQALVGLLAQETEDWRAEKDADNSASAYRMADAMLKAREGD